MGAEFAAHKALLELFCYGTWSEYQGGAPFAAMKQKQQQ
jgi:hypothetical protein